MKNHKKLTICSWNELLAPYRSLNAFHDLFLLTYCLQFLPYSHIFHFCFLRFSNIFVLNKTYAFSLLFKGDIAKAQMNVSLSYSVTSQFDRDESDILSVILALPTLAILYENSVTSLKFKMGQLAICFKAIALIQFMFTSEYV